MRANSPGGGGWRESCEDRFSICSRSNIKEKFTVVVGTGAESDSSRCAHIQTGHVVLNSFTVITPEKNMAFGMAFGS